MRRSLKEVEGADSPTLRNLGINFSEPEGLDMLDRGLRVVKVETADGTVYGAAIEGLTLDHESLFRLLGAIKTNPISQSAQGAREDWKNPYRPKDHADLGKNGEWAKMFLGLPGFIAVADFQDPKEPAFLKFRDMTIRTAIGHLLDGSIYKDFFSHNMPTITKNLGDALYTYAMVDGDQAYHDFFGSLIRNGEIEYMPIGQDCATKVGGWCVDKSFLLQVSDLIRERSDIRAAHKKIVAGFMRYLGDTQTARVWKLLCVLSDDKYSIHPSRWALNQIVLPDSVSVHFTVYTLKPFGIKVNLTRFSPETPAHARIVENGSNEDGDVLNPTIEMMEADSGPEMVPVLAWKARKNGEREWVYGGDDFEAAKQALGIQKTEMRIPNTLAGLHCLAYALPDVRKTIPHEMGFHGGGRKQRMLEGQIPYVVALREASWLNQRLVRDLEERASKK